MKRLELTIICLCLLFIAYTVAGCDEKPADAKELVHEQEVKIINHTNRELATKVTTKGFPNIDGTVPIVVEIAEPNITIPDSTGTDFIITEVETADFSMTPAPSIEWEWSISEMPDEPEQELITISIPDTNFLELTDSDNDKLLSVSEVNWPPVFIRVYDGDKELKYFADPNEPETSYIAIAHLDWECPGCGKKFPIDENHFCLMQYIPTWPNFIELEKDLVIHRPGKEENEFIVMYFHKGTHIYFRDDDD